MDRERQTNPNFTVDELKKLDHFNELPEVKRKEFLEMAVSLKDDNEERYYPYKIELEGSAWFVLAVHCKGKQVMGAAVLRFER